MSSLYYYECGKAFLVSGGQPEKQMPREASLFIQLQRSSVKP